MILSGTKSPFAEYLLEEVRDGAAEGGNGQAFSVTGFADHSLAAAHFANFSFIELAMNISHHRW